MHKLSLLILLNCYLLSAQEVHVANDLNTLNYNYQSGTSYKYIKTTNRSSDKTYSYISIQPLDTMTNSNTWYEFSVDSCGYYVDSRRITTKKEKLENARIHIL